MIPKRGNCDPVLEILQWNLLPCHDCSFPLDSGLLSWFRHDSCCTWETVTLSWGFCSGICCLDMTVHFHWTLGSYHDSGTTWDPGNTRQEGTHSSPSDQWNGNSSLWKYMVSMLGVSAVSINIIVNHMWYTLNQCTLGGHLHPNVKAVTAWSPGWFLWLSIPIWLGSWSQGPEIHNMHMSRHTLMQSLI